MIDDDIPDEIETFFDLYDKSLISIQHLLGINNIVDVNQYINQMNAEIFKCIKNISVKDDIYMIYLMISLI